MLFRNLRGNLRMASYCWTVTTVRYLREQQSCIGQSYPIEIEVSIKSLFPFIFIGIELHQIKIGYTESASIMCGIVL